MMSTYTQILYHVVFSTKYRAPVLNQKQRPVLFKYIWGLLENKRCHLFRLNGIEDHLHILFALHPSVSLASLIKDIKLASNSFIREHHLFSGFNGWQEGYGAFTCGIKGKDRLIEYIKNQEEHHQRITFREELLQLLNEHQIQFNPDYLV